MKDLNECRKEIDEIDQQLIKLFEQRMKISVFRWCGQKLTPQE